MAVPPTTTASAVTTAASPWSWDAAAVTQLRDWMTTNGVAAATQDRLISTLLAGGSWDSATAGAEPVSQATTETSTLTTTVYTYADGSIKVSKMEKPPTVVAGGVQPMNINSCTTTVNNHYQYSAINCDASDSNGVLTMGFTLNYSRYAGGEGWIDGMSVCWHQAIGVGFSQEACHVLKQHGNPAEAEDVGTISSIPPFVSMTVYMDAMVSSTSAYTTSNLSLW